MLAQTMEPAPVDAAVAAIEDAVDRHLGVHLLARWVKLTRGMVERPFNNWELLTERIYGLLVLRRQQLAFRPPGRIR